MEILYQDSGIVVCRKEAGMDSETDVPQALQAQLGVSVLPVHRLDRGTAGLMQQSYPTRYFAPERRAWYGFFWKPGAATRFGYSFPPEATPWLGTTNTAAALS